jgi:hypothetical protein
MIWTSSIINIYFINYWYIFMINIVLSLVRMKQIRLRRKILASSTKTVLRWNTEIRLCISIWSYTTVPRFNNAFLLYFRLWCRIRRSTNQPRELTLKVTKLRSKIINQSLLAVNFTIADRLVTIRVIPWHLLTF